MFMREASREGDLGWPAAKHRDREVECAMFLQTSKGSFKSSKDAAEVGAAAEVAQPSAACGGRGAADSH